MKCLALALTLVLSFLVLPVRGQSAAQAHQEAGRVAADEWLAVVDAGKISESWDKLEPAFAKKVGRKRWVSALNDIRKPLGKFETRTLKKAEYTKELAGAPEGEYVVIEFTSSFEHKKDVTEKVTLLLGRDLFWRVAGYSVK